MFFATSCSKKENTITRSFYHWQSSFDIDEKEKTTLDTLHIQKLYVRFFDVTWEGQPAPAAQVNFSETTKQQIVPVVFITNETLLHIDTEQTKTLAFKISKLLEDILNKNEMDFPQEIQLDCDWNESSKDNYFLLIEEMKKFPLWEKVTWSATIRLHQVKFREKTGVPPVNRGMLMFYNMGTIDDYDAANSIFNETTANQYVDRIDEYPLPLDAAIACFSWGLLFENERLLKIFYPLDENDLPDSLFARDGENIFTARRNFYFEGQFLVAGNQVKLETMTPQLSLEAATLLSKHMKNEPRSVILYHLDTTILNRYANEEFETIFGAFD